jgi:hypothetical protein
VAPLVVNEDNAERMVLACFCLEVNKVVLVGWVYCRNFKNAEKDERRNELFYL